MKTLGKLNIKSGRLLNNNELLALRGGYGCWDCWLYEDGNFVGPVSCCGETPPICAQTLTDELNRLNPEHNWEVDCGCR